MICCEHFIYGYFPSEGYKTIETPDTKLYLDEQDRAYLQQLDGASKSIHQTWLPNSQMIALTYINHTDDDFHRSCRWNHTILFNVMDYLLLVKNSVPDRIKSLFIKEGMQEFGFKLKPLEIEEE